jgi:hypothetical protein
VGGGREGRTPLEAEMRSRAFSMAKALSAFTVEVIIIGNRSQLSNKISPPFTGNRDPHSGSTVPWLIIYNNGCKMSIGNIDADIFL